MVWNNTYTGEAKAEYNQSLGISITLSNLTNAYVYSVMDSDLKKLHRINCTVLDLISPKLKANELEEVDKLAGEIEKDLPYSTQTYKTESGTVVLQNPDLYYEVEKKIRKMYRIVEKLKDKYGYGMKDAEDILAGFAEKTK